MDKKEAAELYDKLLARQRTGKVQYVQDRSGATHRQFWATYTDKQNRRWFITQLQKSTER